MNLPRLAAAVLLAASAAVATAAPASAGPPAVECRDGGYEIAYRNLGQCISDRGLLLDPALLCAARPETCPPAP